MARPSHQFAYADGTPQLGLLGAATSGNLALLERMARKLDGGRGRIAEAVEAVKDNGVGALHLAAAGNRAEVCEYLVEDVRVNVDAVDIDGRTPLVWAINCQRGQVDTVRYLLDQGANPDTVDRVGFTPLHEAAKIGNCEVVKLLLSRGAHVDTFSTDHGTPLHVATKHQQDGVMKILLDHHADFGQLPIQFAACVGTRKDVEILFEVTSPIPAKHDWSVDGILSYVKSQPKLEDLPLYKMSRAKLEEEGHKALHKEDFNAAVEFYTMAIAVDPSNMDPNLTGRRGYCRIRLGNGEGAFNDAQYCMTVEPHNPYSCWLLGYSYVLLKDYDKACVAFLDGLKLMPGFIGIKKALREALRLLKESHADKKNGLEGRNLDPRVFL